MQCLCTSAERIESTKEPIGRRLRVKSILSSPKRIQDSSETRSSERCGMQDLTKWNGYLSSLVIRSRALPSHRPSLTPSLCTATILEKEFVFADQVLHSIEDGSSSWLTGKLLPTKNEIFLSQKTFILFVESEGGGVSGQ
jgi:hypothetical protein